MKKIVVKEEKGIRQIVKEKFSKFNKSSFHTSEVLFLIIITAVISLSCGYILNSSKKQKTNKYIDEIIENYKYILENYYEDVDEDKLVSGAIDGMVNSLDDDYSQLLEQDSSSSFYINLEGTYEGIGVEIYNDDKNNIVVLGVIDKSPAKNAGIKAGDIIKQIDNLSLENTEVSKLTKYVQNNKNDDYKLIIVRDGVESEVVIKRSQITIKSILSKVIEKDNHKIGYIYISVFANATSDQFEEALNELEEQGIDSLIIDVRNNTGGHLTTAVSIVSNFLNSDKIIYQIEKNKKKTKYYSTGYETKKYPIVIIQNHESASASELLSSSLKESYGATIVGTTSYGKGTVQEVVKLENGDTYKFTTKKWLTPKGNWINKKGVKPDVEVELSDDYNKNPKDENDNQLQEAINQLIK